jgi:hypothetical protein
LIVDLLRHLEFKVSFDEAIASLTAPTTTNLGAIDVVLAPLNLFKNQPAAGRSSHSDKKAPYSLHLYQKQDTTANSCVRLSTDHRPSWEGTCITSMQPWLQNMSRKS